MEVTCMGMIKILLDCGYGTFAMKVSLRSPSLYMRAILSAMHLALHISEVPVFQLQSAIDA